MNFTMTKIAAAASLCFAATGAQAVSVSTGGVFDMFQGKGYDQATLTLTAPGTGTVGSDATITGFVDYSAGTWGVASTTPFFGLTWTASGGTLITAAGDYALNTTTGAISAAAPDLVGASDGFMHFTVGAGQMAGAINFAWGSNSGIRVVDVWNTNPNGSLTAVKAPGMENGPFNTFNAAFHLTADFMCLDNCSYTPPVPETATYSMMLVGLGLVWGVARRRPHSLPR